MKKKLKVIVIIFLITTSGFAQIVSTLVSSFPGNDGISIDDNGDIFVNQWGANGVYNGSKVYKVTPQGEVSLFKSGLSVFPSGSIFDQNGNLLITGWSSGNITRISSDGSTANIVASGISGAGGLEVDASNNIYISEYNNHRILKFDENGNNVSVFTDASSIVYPSGITFDSSTGKLYVGNWLDGRISVVLEDGTTSDFVELPTANVGTIMNYNGFIYCTSPLFNKIYKINITTQEVELFAGTGVAGNDDGDASLATFNFPIGISTINGETFYVSETYQGGGRLRVIETNPLAIDDVESSNTFTIYPNPSEEIIQIQLINNNSFVIQALVYNHLGQKVLEQSSSTQTFQIHIKSLPKGVYFINLITNNSIQTKQFIKK